MMIKVIIFCLTLFVGANGQGLGSLLSLFGGLGGNGNTNTQNGQNGMASLGGGSTVTATSTNTGAKKGIYAWGAWGEYGPCTATCGTGEKGRQRACYFFEGLSETDTDGVALSGFTNSIGAEGMEVLPLLLGSGGTGGLFGGGGGLSSIVTLSLLSGGGNGGGILGGLTGNRGNGGTTSTSTMQTGCQGANVNRTVCNLKACPAVVIPPVQPTAAQCLGQWSDYGDCSMTCGVGIQIRFRACNCRNPQTQQFTCTERLTDTKPCPGLLPCPVQPVIPVVPTTQSPPTVVAAEWSEWGEWSGCNARCGEDSTERRLRFCFQINNCQGSFSETRACPNVPCTVEAPVWSQWGEYGACTQSCGSAQKVRRRTCPVENSCAGLSIEVADCGNLPCPTPPTVPVWSNWSPYNDCSATCGYTLRLRFRTCSVEGKCKGSQTETKECIVLPCATRLPTATWEEWSQFGQCFSACGPGQRFRFRVCSIPNQCQGSASDSESCNNPACETAPPSATWGDWGEYSSCTRSCGGGLKSRVRVCNGIGQCPGDGTESLACEEQPCVVQPVPQVGVWSEYGPWRECKRTTFGQACFEERFRSCIGAIQCDGVNVERRICNTGACAAATTPAPTVTNPNQQACDESRAEQRVDCGYPGITREECWARGCCYSDNLFDTTWCFYDRFSEAGRALNNGGI